MNSLPLEAVLWIRRGPTTLLWDRNLRVWHLQQPHRESTQVPSPGCMVTHASTWTRPSCWAKSLIFGDRGEESRVSWSQPIASRSPTQPLAPAGLQCPRCFRVPILGILLAGRGRCTNIPLLQGQGARQGSPHRSAASRITAVQAKMRNLSDFSATEQQEGNRTLVAPGAAAQS